MAKVDLSQLAVDRSPPSAKAVPRRRDWIARYVIPLSILLGFVSVVAWSARASFLPAQSVTVVPVIAARAEVQQAGTPLFQAAGWVEPRPTSVVVSALVEGVVDRLLVVEGQTVQRGDPIAILIDADARLALREAEAALRLKEAELAITRAEFKAAHSLMEQPLPLQAALAESESQLAKLQTDLANLPFAIQGAEARRKLAQQDLEGKQKAGEALAGRFLQRAQSEADSAEAALQELRARKPNLEAEAKALGQRRDVLQQQLQLKTEEHRRHAEADANVNASEARLEQARLAVETAQLRLERMTVKAIISGRVLALHAQPGKRLMGMTAASERDASAVVSLYDPKHLQIRADVRLEDVPHVLPGQPVEIQTAAAKDVIHGEVLAATSVADIQKNTLQVKVAIHDPPEILKPEMLAQVTFLAPESPTQESDGSEDQQRLLVPRQLVETGEGSSHVWLADRIRGTARRQAVTLGKAGTDELIEVVAGLTPTDKLIASGREQLEDGERIRISGDDPTFGLGTRAATAAPQAQDRAVVAGQKPIK